MKQALTDGLSTLAQFVPKLVAFLLILIIGLIIATLIAKAISALLEKVGFDTAVERWSQLPTDDGASFDTEVEMDAPAISPMVTW